MYNKLSNNNASTFSLILPSKVSKRGLTVITCALFIISQTAGSGLLALPDAIVGAGWSGIGLLILCCFISFYCGIVLGNCWTTVRANRLEYQDQVRDPYPTIGWEAGGRVGKSVVQVCLFVTLLGSCIVYLLLASQTISSLINIKLGSIAVKDECRLWILICSAVLLPFTYLATPKDFWPLALGAAATTTVACILVVIKSVIDLPSDLSSVDRGEATLLSFFPAYGTIAFSCACATQLPSFQADMKVQNDFPKAATLAYLFVLVLYLPTSIIPYITYGKAINSNILITITDQTDNNGLATAAKLLIAGHLLLALVITLNPILQQLEELFKTPKTFLISLVFALQNFNFVIIALCTVRNTQAEKAEKPNHQPCVCGSRL